MATDVRPAATEGRPFTGSLSQVWALLVVMVAGILAVPTAAQAPIPSFAPFDMTGFIQSATVDNPNDLFSGGTITINNIRMIVPRNTLLQFPATGMTWQEAFALAPAPYTKLQTGLALTDVPRPATTYEAHVVGNRVGSQHIVGLLFLAQQSLHAGQGFITAIDYARGEMRVGGVTANPALDTRVRINDPIGRFGRAFSPDVRFTIDEDNPTIHTHNFYPMCLPRTDPTVAADSLCPQRNRPQDTTGRFLTLFTMPPPGGSTGPDARLMAPFEVGDFIDYSGIQIPDGSGMYIAAHTIVSNMTIMTAPNTQPAYVGMEVLLMGVSTKAGAPAGTEGAVRTRVEGFSTDVTLQNIVQVMALDVDPCSGADAERTWGFAAVDTLVALGRFRFRPSSKDETFLPGIRELRVRNGSGTMPTRTPNGLLAGEYTAPIFEYLFSEPAPAGGRDPLPNNFWDLQFLAQGSGPFTGRLGQSGILGQLSPWPGALVPDPGCGATTTAPPPPNPNTPAPIAFPDTLAMAGTSVQFPATTLIANDSGAAPVTLVAIAPVSASGGTISGNDPFTFVPGPGFTGSDSFTYEISDASGQTAIGVVTVTATADVTAPSVRLTAPLGGIVSGTVLLTASAADDVGVAGVRFFDGGAPINGEVIAAPFQMSWNTVLASNGSHNIVAIARDVAGNIATSNIVGVTVSNVAANVAPTANADSATTNAGTAVTLAVLANDTDPNGDALTITGVSSPVGGTATVNAGGTITFQPAAGFAGTGSFTYTISDGHGGTATGLATVVVLAPPNQPPAANPDSATTPAGTAITISVLANDSDPNGDPLTVTAVSNAVGGSAAINGGTTVTYTPAAGFAGAGSFTYTISDGRGGTASTSVTVTVTLAAAVDKTVSADGTGTRTTPLFSTSAAGDVLVAFAASDGPGTANAQTLTITGAGLTWTRVRSTAGRPGVVEIWTATAPAALVNVSVTSTQSVTAGGPYNQSLTVVAFTGISGVGASNAASGLSTGASAGLITQAAGSLVYAVGNDFDRALARTLPAGQTKVHEFLAPTGDTFWVQSGSAPIATAGTTVTLSATVPAPADQFNFAIVELKRQ